MRIYLRNNPAKFHPGPIWNDGALGFFKERRPDANKQDVNKEHVIETYFRWTAATSVVSEEVTSAEQCWLQTALKTLQPTDWGWTQAPQQ